MKASKRDRGTRPRRTSADVGLGLTHELGARPQVRQLAGDAIDVKTSAGIASVRTALGLTLEEFGVFLGVAKFTVSRWESGRSSPQWVHTRQLREIADRLANDRAKTQEAARKALRIYTRFLELSG